MRNRVLIAYQKNLFRVRPFSMLKAAQEFKWQQRNRSGNYELILNQWIADLFFASMELGTKMSTF